MSWVNKTTDEAHEIASNSSFDYVEVPVGRWKAVIDSVSETDKHGNPIYDQFCGERKYRMRIQVIEGPGEGGSFLKDLFVLPENSEKMVNRTMNFLSKLSKSISYDGPISEEAFIGKVTVIDVFPKKNGNGNTFRIYDPEKPEQKATSSASPSTPSVGTQGQTGGETVVSDRIPV